MDLLEILEEKHLETMSAEIAKKEILTSLSHSHIDHTNEVLEKCSSAKFSLKSSLKV
jgi:hypothetical protein